MIMTALRIVLALIGGLALSRGAWAQQSIVSREQDIADLRLGQESWSTTAPARRARSRKSRAPR